MGSVKDVIPCGESDVARRGTFVFSDRYSVFDWGRMPDEIPGKGAALCLMSAWNFERLEEIDIPTHYIDLIDNSNNLVKTDELKEPTNRMVVSLSTVIKPDFQEGRYDYSKFKNHRSRIDDYVIPLEVIYRNGAPDGSSFFKRVEALKEDSKELKKFLSRFGLREIPKPNTMFPATCYDFTTKFEETDRTLTKKEAYSISGLEKHHFDYLKKYRNNVAPFISGRAKEIGFVDFDGKMEFTFSMYVRLADVVGTLDENRFFFNGRHVSKELLRQHHKVHQKGWVDAVNQAKKSAEEKGVREWKQFVEIMPRNLEPELVRLVGEMYMSASDRWTGLNLFRVRPLEQVMEELDRYYVVEGREQE